MASLTRWTWVWVNSRSWWWTGRPGVLRFMGLQRVGHDWATDLNCTFLRRVELQKVMSKSWFFRALFLLTICHLNKECVYLNSKYRYYSRNAQICCWATTARFSAGCLVGVRIFLNTLFLTALLPPDQWGLGNQGQPTTDLVPEPGNWTSIFEGVSIIVSPELETAYQMASDPVSSSSIMIYLKSSKESMVNSVSGWNSANIRKKVLVTQSCPTLWPHGL